jgi:hypothetical protein
MVILCQQIKDFNVSRNADIKHIAQYLKQVLPSNTSLESKGKFKPGVLTSSPHTITLPILEEEEEDDDEHFPPPAEFS